MPSTRHLRLTTAWCSSAPITGPSTPCTRPPAKKAWSHGPLGAIDSSPSVANGIVSIGGGPPSTGHLYALNAATGKSMWTLTTDAGVSDTAYDSGVACFSAFTTGTLRAVDASNGNVLGKLTGYPNISVPIISNGLIYISSQGNIFAIGL